VSITAHGASIDVTSEAIVLHHTLLASSLGKEATVSIPLDKVSDTEVVEPTATGFGSLTLVGPGIRILFAPHQQPEDLARAIDAAKRGDAPSTIAESSPGIPALDFTAVDVETANDNWGSICQIGAVRFRDGEEAQSRSWLCTPPPGLESFADVNISIHGITASDVADAPAFAQVASELFDFLGSDILVAHNAQFDSTALRTGLLYAQAPVPEVPLACSLALSREASRAGIIEVVNHRLPTVAKAIGAGDFRHHDAAEDARAAGLIVVGLASRWNYSGDLSHLFSTHGFALGTMSQDSVIPVLRSDTAPTSPADLGAGTDFRDVSRPGGTASKPRGEGQGQGKESSRKGPAPWQSVATPTTIPEPNSDADPQGALYGQHVTLTGDFEPFDKGLLWSGIAQRGGQVGKNVTKKTTILVLGQWATKTSKEKRAEELIAKGQDIALWPASKLISELSLDEEPPF